MPKLGPRILVLKEKHDTSYYDVATDEKLHKVALQIVKERLGDWIMKPDPPGKADEYNLTSEQVAALPEGLRKTYLSNLNHNKRMWREYEKQKAQYEAAVKAVEEKDGKLAFEVMKARQDYEYEEFSLEYLL